MLNSLISRVYYTPDGRRYSIFVAYDIILHEWRKMLNGDGCAKAIQHIKKQVVSLSHRILYGRLLIAAVWIAAIPVLGKYVILMISGVLIITVSHNLLVIAAFAACMIIFVFPCFLLGTVTPSLVKYMIGSLQKKDIL